MAESPYVAMLEEAQAERDAAQGNADANYQRWVSAQTEIERLTAVWENETIVTRDLKAEIERLRAALEPFAEVARGDRLNVGPDDWQRASAVFTNTDGHDQQPAADDRITPDDLTTPCDAPLRR